MSEPLPTFRYVPDPIGAECVVKSETPCACCGKLRGWRGAHFYGQVSREVRDNLCPWCVASGAAHERFGAKGCSDLFDASGERVWSSIPEAMRDELRFRTPSYIAWQSEQWFVCCGEPAAYLGMATAEDLKPGGRYVEAIPIIRAGRGEIDDEDFESDIERSGPQYDCTAYIFRCLHCHRLGGYMDMT